MVRLEQLSYNIAEAAENVSVCVELSIMSESENAELECEVVAALTTINSADLRAGKLEVGGAHLANGEKFAN